MKSFLAVARREILEKRFVLTAAAVAAIVPLLVPVVRGLSGQAARDTRELVALSLALGISGAVAVALGASIFAGELASKRMGFFFSRPVSAAGLWAGKIAAAVTLVAASFLMILVPAFLVNRGSVPALDSRVELPIVVLSLVLLFLTANVFATIVRSRSALALWDMAALIVVGFALTGSSLRLLRSGFRNPALVVTIGGGILFAALFFGAYRAVARGRTDIRAAHRALSAAFWAILGSATIVFVAWAAWVLAAPPSSVREIEAVRTLGSDGWVAFSGTARGASALFLYDTRSSRYERIPAEFHYDTQTSEFVQVSESQPVVTPDGRLAAWLDTKTAGGPWSLKTLRLDRLDAKPQDVNLAYTRACPIVLSADGSRVAALELGLLTVSEIPSGRSLASVRVLGPTPGDSATVSFVTRDLVRILRIHWDYASSRPRPSDGPGLSLEVLELDIAGRKLVSTGRADFDNRGQVPVLKSPAGDRLLIRENRGARITLRDSRSLALQVTLREGTPLVWTALTFLAEGRIVLGLSDKASSWLEVFSREGVPERRIPIAARTLVRIGAEPAAGRLLVSVQALVRHEPGTPFPRSVLEEVDLREGTVRRLAEGLEPIPVWWSPDPVVPGSEASKLVLENYKRLVRLDPATGERRVLLGAH